MKPVGLILKFSEVLGLIGMEKIVRRDNFIIDVIYLEPLQRLSTVDMYSVLGVSVTVRAREFCSKLLETRYLFLQ